MSYFPPAASSIPRKSIGLDHFSPRTHLDNYQVVSCIGQGSFGVIHKVTRKSDGMLFALKQLDYSKMPPKDRKQMLQEVAILDSLKHEHVVQLYDKILDKEEQKIYIVMEYCGGGDLSKIISLAKRSNKPIPEGHIWQYFVQLVLALHHCHWPEERSRSMSGGTDGTSATSRTGSGSSAGQGVAPSSTPMYAPGEEGLFGTSAGAGFGLGGMGVEGFGGMPVPGTGVGIYKGKGSGTGQVLHRDLKPENIFLDEQQEMIKLGDFGLSKNLSGQKFTQTYVGTPLYMPPEILQENKYDTKSDIWSLGCLIFELCTLSSPFASARTQTELLQMVSSGKLPSMPSHLSRELREAVKSMLQLQASKRPSTADLLQMPQMIFSRRMNSLNLRANHMIKSRKELELRLEAVGKREKEVVAAEKQVAEREKQFEQRQAMARAQYEEFLQAQDDLEVERSQWHAERQKEMQDRERERDRERPTLGGGGFASRYGTKDWNAAGKSSPSEGHARRSLIPTRPPLEERGTMPSQVPMRQSTYAGTPTRFAAGQSAFDEFGLRRVPPSPIGTATPLRRAGLKETKSMNSLRSAYHSNGYENTPPSPDYADGIVPMDEGTPMTQRFAGRASVNSPSDALNKRFAGTTLGSRDHRTNESLAQTGDRELPLAIRARGTSLLPANTAANQRPTLSHHAATTIGSGVQLGRALPTSHSADLATLIPAPTYTWREMGTPAKWTPEADDAPSPFIKKPAGPNFVTLLGQAKKATTSKANNLRHLAGRNALLADAVGIPGRQTTDVITEEDGGPLSEASTIRSGRPSSHADSIRALGS